MVAGDKSGRELAFAERRLAESRGRMKSYRDLENSFIPGSVERMRASILVDKIEQKKRSRSSAPLYAGAHRRSEAQ